MAKRLGTAYEEEIEARESYQVSRTSNSGATFGDGDLRHERFLVEAKDHGKEGFTLPRKEFLKIKRQALAWGGGNWAYFYRNAHGEEVVMLNLDLFELMLESLNQSYEAECPHCGGDVQLEIDW